MKIIKDWRFWVCVVSVTALGLLSGIFAINAQEYYKVLMIPVFAPPAWLFGPVWVLLYILMGITFYLILTTKDQQQRMTMISLFIAQFMLNFIWSGLFFTAQNNLLSVIDISILWIILFIQQAYYMKNKPLLMWLMGPYFLWITFASVLNYSILFLN
ncbi:TspO/MBR family protein [Culicoidibacter larvae]|uniref:Tryptophan-rich sensory protein n=1 Tax=Culicoidibacter larvae TaxID=2579976 RepID=A0A5R8QE48_9FIRM|nr:TspO/MBR family protein [Culicoidibacter larvae]TLG75484.1 tryptophan-rich sensory protein [Culicoidibacter larvae]